MVNVHIIIMSDAAGELNKEKIRVLHIVATLDARSGGPAYSVPNLVNALRQAGLAADIFTACSDGCEVAPVAGVRIVEQSVNGIFGLRSWYAAVQKLAVDYHFLHLHGCWDIKLLLAAKAAIRCGKPYAVSPRGMLEPWSLAQGKLKKQLAWQIYQRWVLNNAAFVHATAQMEAENLRKLPGMTTPVEVVANGVTLPEYIDKNNAKNNIIQKYPQLAGRRVVLFLSRLHYKKGIERLLSFWQSNAGLANDWVLVIAGEGQANYVANLQQAASGDIDAGRVIFTGVVYGQIKNDLLAAAELFVLPTASENFGIAIAEALAAGTVVITTTGTPWQEIAEKKCGWWVDMKTQDFEDVLKMVFAVSPQFLADMGQRGRELIKGQYTWTILGGKMLSVYLRFL